jgi:antitoxin VapB
VSNEYKAKVFKSGNSLALRLPKALGLEEGAEMMLREMPMGYAFQPMEKPKRKIDVSKFAGKAPWLTPLKSEDREFDDSPRDWHLLDRVNGGE